MNATSDSSQLATYQLKDPQKLTTPCLLVYPELIASNLQEMLRLAGGAQRLRPHVKTHKTSQIIRMELEAGITKHKCATLGEALMLARAGAADVLIAYPQVGPSMGLLVDLLQRFPETRFSVTVDDLSNAQQLEQCFSDRKAQIDVMLDMDSGMHRTGIAPGPLAVELYAFLSQSESLHAAGLHVYDGQNHQPSRIEREAAVAALMQPVLRFVRELLAAGYSVPALVCGGTPTFPVFANFKCEDLPLSIELSPGTCVLSDFNYGRDYQDMSGIQNAAVLMTRVISKPEAGRVTVDLGHKAVSPDQPAGHRCHFLWPADVKEVGHSEEHLVLETSQAEQLSVGDVLYALPAHICPTVALHSHLQVVRQGDVCDSWPVDARDRVYSGF
ncbi:D-TA family PLP-dependent enzyme [Aureliella helgolandensis]|uniref:D-threonine aldolase n=1 Tax=Aureliella helgolandensis TaxID=2527968 RepID=A0A518FZQ6_9BACT|nr:D-TA family PLP-dependent enzyme [Aureliella helgolandensis]QDV21821.1 D-threonine aldolase [Aureliella helgolandensis]